MEAEPTGTWVEQALAKGYIAAGAPLAPRLEDFVIDRLIPSTGVSIWFGPGSVGKTQLLLWLAAHVANPGATPATFLGNAIKRRGHVLVLSAEDLREHLLARLRTIGESMRDADASVNVEALCDRVHVVAFLSLSDAEFTPRSPALFERCDRDWRPTNTLSDIERFISQWNKAAPKAEDRIIGVILDSAVSMAGFDLTNAEATTNFLFHLNRTARRQEVFWAIIGHTPKAVAIDADEPHRDAVGRLRGSAMWSTTPRAVIEVRQLVRDEASAMSLGSLAPAKLRSIVVATLVKSNTKEPDFSPHALRRKSSGAYEWLDPAALPKSTALPTALLEARLDATMRLLGALGGSATQAAFAEALDETREQYPELADVVADAKDKSAGKLDTLAWLISRLRDKGLIAPAKHRQPIRICTDSRAGSQRAGAAQASEENGRAVPAAGKPGQDTQGALSPEATVTDGLEGTLPESSRTDPQSPLAEPAISAAESKA